MLGFHFVTVPLGSIKNISFVVASAKLYVPRVVDSFYVPAQNIAAWNSDTVEPVTAVVMTIPAIKCMYLLTTNPVIHL